MFNFQTKTLTEQQQHDRMLKTPVPKLLLRLCIPTVLGQLVTVIYNAADTFFVSQINTSASAAVGIVFSLMAIIQALGFGISMGASSLISLRLGEKNAEEANRVASSSLFASFVVGFLLLGFGLPFIRPLMRLLGSSDTVLPYAISYGTYILIAAPVMCASFVLNCVLRAEGQTLRATVGISSGSILNIILDPILIFSCDLGIAGAAIATAFSQLVSFVILLVMFLRGRTILKLRPRYVSRKFRDYYLIISTGLPTVFRQGMASVSAALLNNQAMIYGDAAVAAITIANKVYMLVRNVVIGVGQGFQPIAGYNFGAGDKKRTKDAFRWTCIFGTALCLISTVFIALFAQPIITWFRADDPEVIQIGTVALYCSCAVMPFLAYSTFVNQMYQCLGFRTAATFLASCRQGIFFLPLILILPHFFGIFGIQATQPLSDFLTFLLSVPFQIAFYRRHLSPTAKTE